MSGSRALAACPACPSGTHACRLAVVSGAAAHTLVNLAVLTRGRADPLVEVVADVRIAVLGEPTPKR